MASTMKATQNGAISPNYLININVSGRTFSAKLHNLKKYPDTLLGSDSLHMFYDSYRGDYFFDRDPDLFHFILNYYRVGKIHISESDCPGAFRDELEFFGIPQSAVDECCVNGFSKTGGGEKSCSCGHGGIDGARLSGRIQNVKKYSSRSSLETHRIDHISCGKRSEERQYAATKFDYQQAKTDRNGLIIERGETQEKTLFRKSNRSRQSPKIELKSDKLGNDVRQTPVGNFYLHKLELMEKQKHSQGKENYFAGGEYIYQNIIDTECLGKIEEDELSKEQCGPSQNSKLHKETVDFKKTDMQDVIEVPRSKIEADTDGNSGFKTSENGCAIAESLSCSCVAGNEIFEVGVTRGSRDYVRKILPKGRIAFREQTVDFQSTDKEYDGNAESVQSSGESCWKQSHEIKREVMLGNNIKHGNKNPKKHYGTNSRRQKGTERELEKYVSKQHKETAFLSDEKEETAQVDKNGTIESVLYKSRNKSEKAIRYENINGNATSQSNRGTNKVLRCKHFGDDNLDSMLQVTKKRPQVSQSNSLKLTNDLKTLIMTPCCSNVSVQVILQYIYGLLILLSAFCNTIETIDCKQGIKCGDLYPTEFFAVETFFVIVFSLDYIIRFLLSHQKLAFIRKILNIIDLLAILPYYLELFLTFLVGASDVMITFRVLRVLRLIKFTRSSPRLKALLLTLKNSFNDLLLLYFIFVLGILLFGSAVYYAERDGSNANNFTSIPDSLWFTCVTMVTTGYGDVVPVTIFGKIFAALCGFCGVLIMSLPIPIMQERKANVNT